jgi:hypothetical protein
MIPLRNHLLDYLTTQTQLRELEQKLYTIAQALYSTLIENAEGFLKIYVRVNGVVYLLEAKEAIEVRPPVGEWLLQLTPSLEVQPSIPILDLDLDFND